MDDDELLQRCQRGDNSALDELVRQFQDRLFRLAYRVLADAARAEDATVDALSVVWARCGSWRGEAHASTWIHQVAWRVILDHQRARRRWWRIGKLDSSAEHASTSDIDPAVTVAAGEEQACTRQHVQQALLKLSADERALVHLHYFEGLPLAEIATILAVSRDSLKMRLSRVRNKLRPLLGELDGSV